MSKEEKWKREYDPKDNFMFYKCIELIPLLPISHLEARVLTRLVIKYVNGDDRQKTGMWKAWPSEERLAYDVRSYKTSMRRAAIKLEFLDILSIEKKDKENPRSVNLYIINPFKIVELSQKTQTYEEFKKIHEYKKKKKCRKEDSSGVLDGHIVSPRRTHQESEEDSSCPPIYLNTYLTEGADDLADAKTLVTASDGVPSSACDGKPVGLPLPEKEINKIDKEKKENTPTSSSSSVSNKEEEKKEKDLLADNGSDSNPKTPFRSAKKEIDKEFFLVDADKRAAPARQTACSHMMDRARLKHLYEVEKCFFEMKKISTIFVDGVVKPPLLCTLINIATSHSPKYSQFSPYRKRLLEG